MSVYIFQRSKNTQVVNTIDTDAFTVKISNTIKNLKHDPAHCKVYRSRYVALNGISAGDEENCNLYKFRVVKSVQKLGQDFSEISIVRFSNIASLISVKENII